MKYKHNSSLWSGATAEENQVKPAGQQGRKVVPGSLNGRRAVLLVNLGTPDEATTPALRRYLQEFLADPRVVEAPRLIWWFALNGVILRIRPARSARSYRKVFDEKGSPLLYYTRQQSEALGRHLAELGQEDVLVDFAMRYGNPSMSGALQSLIDRGVRRLLVLPRYPQYSASTSASAFDALAADFRKRRLVPDLRFISQYHDYEPFIEAAAARIRSWWQEHGRAQKLAFSFHGIPQRYVEAGDPYQAECLRSASLIAERLELSEPEYLVVFQSRFGREEWLRPYADETFRSLPGQGVTELQVFCPGFSADCLETIEEIGEENRDYFLEAGGRRYEYISALNDRPEHIEALGKLVIDNLQGWD